MYQVMVTSEQRSVVRRLYSLLERRDDLQLKVVLFSHNAVEQISRVKPDILILDTDIIVPYGFILEELKQRPWEYGLILLGPDARDVPKGLAYVQLAADELTKRALDHAIETLLSATSPSGRAAAPDTEKYHVFAVLPCDVQNMEAVYARLSDTIKPYAGAILQRQSGGCSAALLADPPTADEKPEELANTLLRACGCDAMVLYEKNAAHGTLPQAAAQLFAHREVAYFLKGRCVCLSALDKKDTPDNAALQYAVSKIAEASLSGRSDAAEQLLQALFFRVLKPSCAMGSMEYALFLLCSLLRLEHNLLDETMELSERAGKCIEDDYEALATALRRFGKRMKYKKLSPLVTASIVGMLAELNKELFMADMANRLGVSKGYLSRLFHEQTGSTFVGLLQQLRLGAARCHLRRDEMNISQVAAAVGYADPNYFGRQYKKAFGVTPFTAREQMRQGIGQGAAPQRGRQEEDVL